MLPVLPIALMFSGYALAALEAPNASQREVKGPSKSYSRGHFKLGLAVFFLLATNIPMALYMSVVHQVSF